MQQVGMHAVTAPASDSDGHSFAFKAESLSFESKVIESLNGGNLLSLEGCSSATWEMTP